MMHFSQMRLTMQNRWLVNKSFHSENYALDAINKAMGLLETFPFTCRKAKADNPFLRELIITFGTNGNLVLFEIT